MANERPGAVTFKGAPLTLIGPELKVGDKAPDFTLINNAMQPVKLSSSSGKTRLILAVPSLDTPVCAIEAKKFNDKAAAFGDSTVTYVVSLDLPFAQKRFLGEEKATNVVALSDYQDREFGQAYGTLIKELKILSRAVFVVGPDDTIKYVEYVPEVAQEPNYEKALAAVQG